MPMIATIGVSSDLRALRSEPQISAENRPDRSATAAPIMIVSTRPSGAKLANVVFASIQDRRGRSIISVRDQNTFDLTLRKKRLMTLAQLFLMQRYKADSIHYLTPTDDNHKQAESMQKRGIFSAVNDEVGQIIVAEIDKARVAELAETDRKALTALITAK